MKIVATVCLLLWSITINAQASIVGVWNTGNDNTKIEIAEVEGGYEGKIVSSDNTKANVGKRILKNVQAASGTWKGEIFAAKRGKWMDAVIEEKKEELEIIVGTGWKSKTLKWTKG
ncbi:MAG: hypothetical protein AAF960_09560 [Bacteroidota bacterium]